MTNPSSTPISTSTPEDEADRPLPKPLLGSAGEQRLKDAVEKTRPVAPPKRR